MTLCAGCLYTQCKNSFPAYAAAANRVIPSHLPTPIPANNGTGSPPRHPIFAGSLPPLTPPRLSAALHAGLLPSLERLVRRCGREAALSDLRVLLGMLGAWEGTGPEPELKYGPHDLLWLAPGLRGSGPGGDAGEQPGQGARGRE